ncbi:hypothetical protein [Amycolatopsis kentuckyensis]|uniref:hypothetical protein n=1 Tax=Amycolatopsis kentuckyensis TaxID=218823 RepID=UPI0035636B61
MASRKTGEQDEVLTTAEQNAATSDVAFRRFVMGEIRRHTLLLTEIRDHFASWAPEEP